MNKNLKKNYNITLSTLSSIVIKMCIQKHRH